MEVILLKVKLVILADGLLTENYIHQEMPDLMLVEILM